MHLVRGQDGPRADGNPHPEPDQDRKVFRMATQTNTSNRRGALIAILAAIALGSAPLIARVVMAPIAGAAQ